MLLSFLSEFSGILLIGVIIALVFGGIIGGLELFAIVAEWIIAIKRRQMRRVEVSNGHTVSQSVRIFFDSNNMKDVQIKKSGFWNNMLFGNHYSPKKNTFFIWKRRFDSTNLRDVSLGIQRAAKAINYRNGDAKTKRRISAETFAPFGAFLIIPIILVGAVIDLLTHGFDNGNPIFTLIATCVALVFFIILSVYAFLGIKVEKTANATALEIMGRSNFLTAEEYSTVESLYKWNVISYIVDFLITIIRIIQLLLRILILIFKIFGKKN